MHRNLPTQHTQLYPFTCSSQEQTPYGEDNVTFSDCELYIDWNRIYFVLAWPDETNLFSSCRQNSAQHRTTMLPKTALSPEITFYLFADGACKCLQPVQKRLDHKIICDNLFSWLRTAALHTSHFRH